MLQGFKRLADSLADLELDLPRAREDFECIKETAEMQGWLPDAGMTNVICSAKWVFWRWVWVRERGLSDRVCLQKGYFSKHYSLLSVKVADCF